MKAMLISLVMLSGFSLAQASMVYDVKMKIDVKGRHFFSPGVLTAEGQTARIAEKTGSLEKFVEVTASEEDRDRKGVLMRFVVGEINEKGEKTILATPEVFTQEGKPAKVSVAGPDGAEDLTMTVNAKRRNAWRTTSF